jgi:hypothetical protein
VNALPGNGQNALVGKEKLLDRPVGGSVTAVRSVAFELGTVEGGDTSLETHELQGMRRRLGNVLTWLLPVHSNSCVVSNAKVETGVAG